MGRFCKTLHLEERAFRDKLQRGKPVPILTANPWTSFAEFARIPVTKDHLPEIQMSRAHIVAAISYESIEHHISLLEQMKDRFNQREDKLGCALSSWQLNYAHHRAAFLSKSDDHKQKHLRMAAKRLRHPSVVKCSPAVAAHTDQSCASNNILGRESSLPGGGGMRTLELIGTCPDRQRLERIARNGHKFATRRR